MGLCFEKYIFLCSPPGIFHGYKRHKHLEISRWPENFQDLEKSRAPGNFKGPWKFQGLLEISRGVPYFTSDKQCFMYTTQQTANKQPTNNRQTTNRQLNKHGSTRSTFHQLHEVGYSAASTGHKVKKPSALHVNFIYSVPNMIFSLIWPSNFMVNKSTEKRPQGQNTNCST